MFVLVPLLATTLFVVSGALYVPADLHTMPHALARYFASNGGSPMNVQTVRSSASSYSSASAGVPKYTQPVVTAASTDSYTPTAVPEHYVGPIPTVSLIPSTLSSSSSDSTAVSKTNAGYVLTQPSESANSFAETTGSGHKGSAMHTQVPISSVTLPSSFAVSTASEHTNDISTSSLKPFPYPDKNTLHSVSLSSSSNSYASTATVNNPVDFTPVLLPVSSASSGTTTGVASPAETSSAAYPAQTSHPASSHSFATSSANKGIPSSSSYFASAGTNTQNLHPVSISLPEISYSDTVPITTASAHTVGPAISTSSSSASSTAAVPSTQVSASPLPIHAETSSGATSNAYASSMLSLQPEEVLKQSFPYPASSHSFATSANKGIASLASSFASAGSNTQDLHPVSMSRPEISYSGTVPITTASAHTVGPAMPTSSSSASSTAAVPSTQVSASPLPIHAETSSGATSSAYASSMLSSQPEEVLKQSFPYPTSSYIQKNEASAAITDAVPQKPRMFIDVHEIPIHNYKSQN